MVTTNSKLFYPFQFDLYLCVIKSNIDEYAEDDISVACDVRIYVGDLIMPHVFYNPYNESKRLLMGYEMNDLSR